MPLEPDCSWHNRNSIGGGRRRLRPENLRAEIISSSARESEQDFALFVLSGPYMLISMPHSISRRIGFVHAICIPPVNSCGFRDLRLCAIRGPVNCSQRRTDTDLGSKPGLPMPHKVTPA